MSCEPTCRYLAKEIQSTTLKRHTFTGALFPTAETQKSPTRPSKGDWIKRGYLDATAYYSAVKNNEISPFGTNVDGPGGSCAERNQVRQRTKIIMRFRPCVTIKNKTKTQIQRMQRRLRGGGGQGENCSLLLKWGLDRGTPGLSRPRRRA